jgi:hypothetical protein
MSESLGWSAKCPACDEWGEFDPYESIPAGFGDPFPCPHCGTQIELDCEDTPNNEGDYEWVYWFNRSRTTDRETARE